MYITAKGKADLSTSTGPISAISRTFIILKRVKQTNCHRYRRQSARSAHKHLTYFTRHFVSPVARAAPRTGAV